MMGWERYWALVTSLISRGIVTREQWSHADRAEYEYYIKKGRSAVKFEVLFRDVRQHMFWTKRLVDYVVNVGPPKICIRNNPFFKVLLRNGYDPVVVGSVILSWASLDSPRNTIWIKGSPETGAPYFAEAIAYCCPLVTCVDWRRVPQCVEKGVETLLFWWDGGAVMERWVDLCKQVFRGESVMFPGEDNRLVELVRVPVLVYARHDFCRVMSRWGVFSDEYVSGLRDSMYCVEFSVPSRGLECVSCNDIKEFLTWVMPRTVLCPDTFDFQ
ncbi:ORF2 [turkey adenovirus 4]|uniref:ORF2 n=1 Tax=turkey adenovirus 4 TaxID=1408257 RepID=U5NEA5_9ADEN|nr:ORF2 [Turkey aviadenovirus 4]AGX93295.1 ORF2 [Turkey aviadenovirus 4]